MIEKYPLTQQKAAEVAGNMLVSSDQGLEFNNKVVEDFISKTGIERIE